MEDSARVDDCSQHPGACDRGVLAKTLPTLSPSKNEKIYRTTPSWA